MDETYNGWTNKPTWLVKLWIDNDQNIQEMWLSAAKQYSESAKRPTADTYILDEDSRATYMLSRALEAEFESICLRRLTSASFQSDLMSYALACVNWDEVAKAIIEDAKELA